MTTERGTGPLFQGSIPEIYERLLVPLIFEPYARDVARRIEGLDPTRVLELAAGTGVLTREMADRLAEDVEIVATDLSPQMLEIASARGTSHPVEWRQCDATDLPFDDASFDVVVCQFGVMFLPDRPSAFAGMRRVLRPAGTLVFDVWDGLETNDITRVVNDAICELFADDPPRFMERVPHGYHDPDVIRAELAAGGFSGRVEIKTVEHTSRAASARDVAIAFCQGTPMWNEITARNGDVAAATDHAAAAVQRSFGDGPVEGRITAHIVSVAANDG